VFKFCFENILQFARCDNTTKRRSLHRDTASDQALANGGFPFDPKSDGHHQTATTEAISSQNLRVPTASLFWLLHWCS